MIVQVTGRLSRGSLQKGVMNGKPMLLLLPLGESALKRLDPLGGVYISGIMIWEGLLRL